MRGYPQLKQSLVPFGVRGDRQAAAALDGLSGLGEAGGGGDVQPAVIVTIHPESDQDILHAMQRCPLVPDGEEVALRGTDLHARQDDKAGPDCGVSDQVAPRHGVVVGDGDGVQAGAERRFNDFLRRAGP